MEMEMIQVGFGWIDFVIIVLTVICLFIGYKLGLVKALLLAGFIYGAVVLAARYSDSLSGEIQETFGFIGESFADVLANLAFYVGAVAAAFVVAFVVRLVLKIVLLGWIDKLGGLILGGLLAIVAFSGLLIGIVSSDFNIAGVSCMGVSQSVVSSYIFNNIFTPLWNGSAFLHGLLPQEGIVERIDLIVEGGTTTAMLCPPDMP